MEKPTLLCVWKSLVLLILFIQDNKGLWIQRAGLRNSLKNTENDTVKSKKLPLSFYSQETTKVACGLLGKRLVRILKKQRLSGLIYEVEAYLGVRDPSCHTYKNKKSLRNQVMYEKGGTCYVYFTYGMHYCFNVVTSRKSVPEAVLIRSVFPFEGVQNMFFHRKHLKRKKDIANGPAKLCQALQIDRKFNGVSLDSDLLFIEKDFKKTGAVLSSERVGLNPSYDSCFWPLRFYLKEYESLITV